MAASLNLASAPRIAVTMGDPAGIGPELVCRLIADGAEDVDIHGDLDVLRGVYEKHIGAPLPNSLSVVDRGLLHYRSVRPGQPDDEGAFAQAAYLESAALAAREGRVHGIVTAPVSKTQLARAGLTVPGQTEFFAERLSAKDFGMMFAGPRYRVVLATIHVPLAEVPSLLSERRITDVTSLALASLRDDFGITSPRIGILGLNPHSGEGGRLGREEIDVIEPAIASLRSRHPAAHFEGPLPPDSAFRMAMEPGRFDLLVCMYHDQGLGPLKVLDFEGSVNMTIGLPVVRTSPDHGVAYDIAGQGIASAAPFMAAVRLARDIARRRAADM